MLRDADTAHAVHYVFEWTALAAGGWWYRYIRRQNGAGSVLAPGNFAVLVGCLLGAALGNKLAFWIDSPHLWRERAGGLGWLTTGQSVIGALLGGWLGVEVGKRVAGITARTGDDFVRPILLGLIVGRIGCFLAGLHDGTYGLPTDRPWGLDFGDSIPRHPVALYEILVALTALATWPVWHRPLAARRGLSFRVLVLGYLLWRIVVDLLKPVPFAYPFGLSGLQWICVAGAAVVLVGLLRDQGRPRHV